MRFGKVIGQVVLSHHEASLAGARWLLVQPLDKRAILGSGEVRSREPSLVVYDCLGAHTGQWIGFTEGGEALLPFEKPIPIDAYNAAILDRICIGETGQTFQANDL